MSAASIILVEPQMGENIGAAARAMLNFGLTDLRLVNPRDGWPNDRAIAMGAGAFEHLAEPQIFDTLKDAIADLQFTYATSARRRDMVKPVFTPQGAVEDIGAKRTGFVFGPERTGLSNDDIALCNALIHIPTNPDFASINLAQSVLLLAYELSKANDDNTPRTLSYGDSEAVPTAQLEEFLSRLEGELDTARFFKEQNLKPTMLRNIRAMFTRAELSTQEVKTLHGMVSALIKTKQS